ncbi:MAG: Chromate transport protein ChrA [Myxococcales bacterium]|nr:Chromate transport protein ChrA [Myxococcales bacterium]
MPKALSEVALLFLRLGTTAFGGPAAHIAMMEDEVVTRRGWVSRDEFLDLVGATNLIPGPNSTELAIHLGYRRAGWLGLIVAGLCFILPAAAIVTLIAWAYVRFGTLPAADALMSGVKPVVIAIVLLALWRLARTAIKTPLLGVIAAACIAGLLLGLQELALLAGAGVMMALTKLRRTPTGAWLPLGVLAPAAAATATAFTLGHLFLTFLKIGSVLFGSGYVLLAFLRADFVERLHWISETQLADAVAVGQVTPGPLFTTATFIGYVLGGVPGAAVATLAIFLPAFVFVAISGPLIPWLRTNAAAGAFLDGVNVASLALMAVVTYQLGRVSIIDLPTILIAVAAAFALRFKVGSVWLVLAGAVVGVVLGQLVPGWG